MSELVFLLEEPSAKAMLESLLPRMLDARIAYRCIPFEGKQDLEKQLARKIRGYQNPQARFIVLRDQDSAPDCKLVKQRLLDLCKESGKQDHCLVRIACCELEAFYLADLGAVEKGMQLDGLEKLQKSSKFKNPDKLGSPSAELKKLTKDAYQKVSGSREIGKHLALDNPRSPSFRNLMAAIGRMQQQLLQLPS